MEIKILQLLDGASKARGLTVIIDVFRAFTVEAFLANNGAVKICPVGDKEIAYKAKEEDGSVILIGERQGKILPGFDYGNSPSSIENVDFTGKTVIHTTSAGTQGIANAKGASEIITGSLVNAGAIAKYIKDKKPDEVSLVCMGLACEEPTDEDTLCANYIKSLIEEVDFDLKSGIEKLASSSGEKFFDSTLSEIFPERDFYLSTEVSRFDFVLRLVKNANGLDYVEKINVK